VVAAFVSAAAVLIFWIRFLNWAYLRPKRLEKLLRKQGFKGNRYRFVSGDSKEIQQIDWSCRRNPINLGDDIKPNVAGFFAKSIKTYGNCCFYWAGPTPTVILNDPEMVKEVLNKPDFYGRPRSSNPLGRLLARGLVHLEGQKWLKHRRLMNPAFHLDKLKLMLPAFKSSCEEVLNEWEKKLSFSAEIDVWPYIQTIASDSISRTAFGSSYEEGRKIFQLQREQAEYVLEAMSAAVYVPGSQYLPTRRNRRMKEIDREVVAVIRGLIRRRMDAGGEERGDDLLGLMLESNEMEQPRGGMSMDDIVEECKLFYLAGQETTAALILWTMVLLGRHPEWQDKSREEVLHVFGKNTPDFEGLTRLRVVNKVLLEVLRLYPSLSSIGRRVKEQVKVGEVTLPAGVNVTLPIIFLHHDAEIWGADALEFNPERFGARIGGGAYIPFSWGPRVCIGQAFAMVEAKIAVSMILQSFSFRLSPSYVHAPITRITTQPQHGARLILHKL
ncbi:hypothetical protein M569_13218, partial [Genlisea aurea]